MHDGPDQLIAATFVCRDCGVLVEVTDDERRWYVGRGWTLPRRCADCRALRRQQAAGATTAPPGTGDRP